MDILSLLNRSNELFINDIKEHENEIDSIIQNSNFLVIGAAGSIGMAVTEEIFKRKPKRLHAIDISENNLVELVRFLRSSVGYIEGDFKTYAISCAGPEFKALLSSNQKYDIVLNLSAMKHVRSERDPYTLMRLIRTNIMNTVTSLELSRLQGASKYFCVSSDKATNPVNMMGASKRIMEMFLAKENHRICVSTARFANVAFSDGSLLHGFMKRFTEEQPITAPRKIERYFITPKESGELCLFTSLLANSNETFFPKLKPDFQLIKFTDIATAFLDQMGFTAYECDSEEEARGRASELIKIKKWPVFFFESDTSGEKSYEEFYSKEEENFLDNERFNTIGVIRNTDKFDKGILADFEKTITDWIEESVYDRSKIIDLFASTLQNFSHIDTGKFLDEKM